MRLPVLFRNRNFYLMLAADAVLVAASITIAFLLRFEGNIPPEYSALLVGIFPYIIPLKLFMFYGFKLYHGMWRYTSLRDLRGVVLASFFTTLALIAVLFLHQRNTAYPRSIFILDFALTCMLIGGVRLLVRLSTNHLAMEWKRFVREPLEVRRIGVVGAGRGGEQVVREMLDNPGLHMLPVALLDDDPRKWGKHVHGCPVLGRVELLLEHGQELDEILISMTTVKGDRMRTIVSLCEQTGKPFRTLPNLDELMNGGITLTATRDVRLEDLFVRDEVMVDEDLLRQAFQGKRILVTGAGGDLGAVLARLVAEHRPQAVGLVDISEFNLYRVDPTMRRLFPDLEIQAFLADIQDKEAVSRVMRVFGPQVILHAAGLKHVPLQEDNPGVAVRANIVGTRNLTDAALEHGVELFVLLSTTMAEQPANVAQATKRGAEMVVQAANGKDHGRYVSVRFGNVLGGSASVVSIFESQIAGRRPLTVTHPEATRCFIRQAEAAKLILQAGAMARGGEIFILDMGRPVKIEDMARELIRLHGLEADSDVPLAYSGARPGEQLHGPPDTAFETGLPTRHDKIRVVRDAGFDHELFAARLDHLRAMAQQGDVAQIKACLTQIPRPH